MTLSSSEASSRLSAPEGSPPESGGGWRRSTLPSPRAASCAKPDCTIAVSCAGGEAAGSASLKATRGQSRPPPSTVRTSDTSGVAHATRAGACAAEAESACSRAPPMRKPVRAKARARHISRGYAAARAELATPEGWYPVVAACTPAA